VAIQQVKNFPAPEFLILKCSMFYEKGGDYVEGKYKRIKCPSCLNYMMVMVHESGEAKGFCKKCNAVITAKRASAKEQVIRIVKP